MDVLDGQDFSDDVDGRKGHSVVIEEINTDEVNRVVEGAKSNGLRATRCNEGDDDAKWNGVTSKEKGVEQSNFGIQHGANNDDVQFEHADSNELLSLYGLSLEDEDNSRRKPRFPEFRAKTDMKECTCLDALKKGFREACKPLVCSDASL
ncbi:unnamed protein product [Ilex paraguariensis]|uniref:Uncharacterized protein n=1 Tax=Ilex paraguariensis TaxID=185542 RepID=A0ABC8S8Q8_9AQUA